MTKKDFIKKVAEVANFRQVNVNEVFDAAEKVLIDTVKSGESVNVFRWFKVETEIKPERTCRNPKTGESVVVPEHRGVKGKFTKAFKEAIQ